MSDTKIAYSGTEAAAALGISYHSFLALCKRKARPLPHFNVGRRIVVPRAELNAWLSDESCIGDVRDA